MNLTTAQLAALKADILADGTLSQIDHTSNAGYVQLAAAYNALASPDYWVWRTRVGQEEYVGVTSQDATDWSWTVYINRSQGERDAWREMFADTGAVNPSRANIRQAVADIFSGAGGATQRTHLLSISRRKATRAEKLFATGAGSTTTPSVMTAEGAVTSDNISQAFS